MSNRIGPLFVLVTCVTLAVGCGGGGAVAPEVPLPAASPALLPRPVGATQSTLEIDSFFAGTAVWPVPDELLDENEEAIEPGDEQIGGTTETIQEEMGEDVNGQPTAVTFHCTEKKMRITDSFDTILSVAGNAGVLWPGALVQGRTIRDGNPAGLHLPRSSIKVSIDLAIPRPSAVLKDPTSASYQEVLSDFMRQADEMITQGGDGADDFLDRLIPARLNFVRQEAHSFEQMLIKAGLNLKYDGLFAKGALSAAFGLNRSAKAHTIFVRFMQPMFTVTFADEAKGRPSDYFDSEMTMDDINYEISRGTLGQSPANGGTSADDKNQACYIKSVTYGRMMMFTMTSTEVQSALDLDVAIEAEYKVLSGDASLSFQQRQTMENSSIQMMAFGGTQEDALAAIRVEPIKYRRDADGNIEYEMFEVVLPGLDGQTGTADDITEMRRGNPKVEELPAGEGLNAFFKPGPASTAVPLVYRINRLRDGLTATVASATEYTTRECTPVLARKKHRFDITLLNVVPLDEVLPGPDGMFGTADDLVRPTAVTNADYNGTPLFNLDVRLAVASVDDASVSPLKNIGSNTDFSGSPEVYIFLASGDTLGSSPLVGNSGHNLSSQEIEALSGGEVSARLPLTLTVDVDGSSGRGLLLHSMLSQVDSNAESGGSQFGAPQSRTQNFTGIDAPYLMDENPKRFSHILSTRRVELSEGLAPPCRLRFDYRIFRETVFGGIGGL